METSSDGKQIVSEVPDDLKKLVKMIVRGFSPNKEDAILMEYLSRNTIMNENQLFDLLKIDRKMLRSVLNRLKAEHFLKDRLRIEIDKDGKSVKQYYFYIDYQSLVNVVKYKLHQMQKKIESQEREDSCKASYICSNEQCSRTYSELDIDKLMDFTTLDPLTGEAKMICNFCGREVTERAVEQTTDTRQILIKFNQQLEPVYEILRLIENYTLSHSILEPAIGGDSADDANNERVATDPMTGLPAKPVTIDFNAQQVEEKVKEVPSWMRDSTITSNQFESVSKTGLTNTNTETSSSTSNAALLDQEKIKKTLMFHENTSLSHVSLVDKKQIANNQSRVDNNVVEDEDDDDPNSVANQIKAAESSFSMRSSQQDEMMSEDEEDSEPEEELIATVNGVNIPFEEVTQEQIAEMTAAEKEQYAKLGQLHYSKFMD